MKYRLHFITDSPVTADCLEDILADAALQSESINWKFCDPLLPAVDDSGCLQTWSDIEIAANTRQELTTLPEDIRFLFETIVRWSHLHDQRWQVLLERLELGTIEYGFCDDQILDKMLACIGASNVEANSLHRNQLKLFDPEE